jgi:hypothetical protein
MIRSILAVIAGIVTLAATSFAIEAAANPLLMKMFPHTLPNEAALNHNTAVKLITLGYTALCVVGGGFVTAWIARESKVIHAVVMGVILAGLTVALMLDEPQRAPRWAWVALIVMSVPMAWLGAALLVWRSKLGTGETA